MRICMYVFTFYYCEIPFQNTEAISLMIISKQSLVPTINHHVFNALSDFAYLIPFNVFIM